MGVQLDHVASFIVNANHSIMRAAVKFGVVDCIADCAWLAVTQDDRMAAHRKLGRRRLYLCAGGLRKCAWLETSGCQVYQVLTVIGSVILIVAHKLVAVLVHFVFQEHLQVHESPKLGSA
jgi:hypothetical protein